MLVKRWDGKLILVQLLHLFLMYELEGGMSNAVFYDYHVIVYFISYKALVMVFYSFIQHLVNT